MKDILAFLFLFSSLSCSHVRSGQYVYFESNTSLEQFKRRYEVDHENLKKYNKEKSIKPGQWVFIPEKRSTFWDKAIDKHLEVNSKATKELIETALIESKQEKKKQQIEQDKSLPNTPALGFIWPVAGKIRISSYFGPRNKKFHEGIDIAVPVGREIIASERGEVIYANNKIGGYGNLVIINHGQDFFSLYAHAKKMHVKKGDIVDKGQLIALVGLTGRTSGPHLHFEIRKGERAVNPKDLLPDL